MLAGLSVVAVIMTILLVIQLSMSTQMVISPSNAISSATPGQDSGRARRAGATDSLVETSATVAEHQVQTSVTVKE